MDTRHSSKHVSKPCICQKSYYFASLFFFLFTNCANDKRPLKEEEHTLGRVYLVCRASLSSSPPFLSGLLSDTPERRLTTWHLQFLLYFSPCRRSLRDREGDLYRARCACGMIGVGAVLPKPWVMICRVAKMSGSRTLQLHTAVGRVQPPAWETRSLFQTGILTNAWLNSYRLSVRNKQTECRFKTKGF